MVARMTLAATLIMIIGMTFRIPYTFQGAIYALMISRESRQATLKSAGTILLVTGIGAAYLLIVRDQFSPASFCLGYRLFVLGLLRD
jgi:multidrug resistance protein MdtO